MKTLTSKLLVLFCLLTTAAFAHADDWGDERRGIPTLDRLEWSLGSFRGGNRGYEILYKDRGSRRWHRAPGAAVDVAEGWVLGTDRHRGGYGIYRWNGRDWSRMPGEAVRIGGSYHQPWVINEQGIRFVWNGYQWRDAGLASRNGNDRNGHDDKRRNRREDFRQGLRENEHERGRH